MKICRIFALALALIVPLQAMAAVAAAQCMALGHHNVAVGHETHASMQAGFDEHDHGAHLNSDQAQENAGDGSGQNGHCSPCTACCASASIAAPPTASISSFPSDAAYVWPQLPPLGVLPRALDRPPLPVAL